MTWTVDNQLRRTFGEYYMVSERDGSETAHLVTFPDGRQLRVLPDEYSSGQRRAQVVRGALELLAALGESQTPLPAGYDPRSYLVGCLTLAGLTWETVSDSQTIEEWLYDWFANDYPSDIAGDMLLKGLERDGWTIVGVD